LPSCSPDSQWAVYVHRTVGKPSLWRVSIEGGEPMRLPDNAAQRLVVSPNGKLIACSYQENPAKDEWKVAVIPFEGGAPIKIFNLPTHPFWNAPFRWTSDGGTLVYRINRDGVDNLWSQPLDGRSPTQLTHFGSEERSSFAWSPPRLCDTHRRRQSGGWFDALRAKPLRLNLYCRQAVASNLHFRYLGRFDRYRK
jgi:Tol biopolymer transport system component